MVNKADNTETKNRTEEIKTGTKDMKDKGESKEKETEGMQGKETKESQKEGKEKETGEAEKKETEEPQEKEGKEKETKAEKKETEGAKENVEIEMEKVSEGEVTKITEKEKITEEEKEEKTQPQPEAPPVKKKIKKEKKPKPIEKIANVKIKRKLEGEEKRLFKIAIRMKDKKPKFLRQQYGMVKRLKEVWRKPKGIDSKLRVEKRGQGHLVKIGYKKPESIRGIHPSGYWPVRISNLKDLEDIDKERQAIIIASQIGRKKRNEIIKKANELNIVILNPRKGEI